MRGGRSRPVLGVNTGTAILPNSRAEDRSRGPAGCPAGEELQYGQPVGVRADPARSGNSTGAIF